jgi:hypothetical protein
MEIPDQGVDGPQIQHVQLGVNQQSPFEASPRHIQTQPEPSQRPHEKEDGHEDEDHSGPRSTGKLSKQRGDGGHGGPGRKPRACKWK